MEAAEALAESQILHARLFLVHVMLAIVHLLNSMYKFLIASALYAELGSFENNSYFHSLFFCMS